MLLWWLLWFAMDFTRWCILWIVWNNELNHSVKVWWLYSSQPQSFPLDGVLLSCFLKKSLLVSVILNLPFTECVFHCGRVHYRSERNMNGDFWSRLCVLRPMRCVSVVHSLMSVDYCRCRHVWNGSIFFFCACLFVAFCLFSKSILKCFCGRLRAGVSLQDFPFSNV